MSGYISAREDGGPPGTKKPVVGGLHAAFCSSQAFFKPEMRVDEGILCLRVQTKQRALTSRPRQQSPCMKNESKLRTIRSAQVFGCFQSPPTVCKRCWQPAVHLQRHSLKTRSVSIPRCDQSACSTVMSITTRARRHAASTRHKSRGQQKPRIFPNPAASRDSLQADRSDSLSKAWNWQLCCSLLLQPAWAEAWPVRTPGIALCSFPRPGHRTKHPLQPDHNKLLRRPSLVPSTYSVQLALQEGLSRGPRSRSLRAKTDSALLPSTCDLLQNEPRSAIPGSGRCYELGRRLCP